MLVKYKDYNSYFLWVKIAMYWFMQLMLWQHLGTNSEDRQPIANQHNEIFLKNTFPDCDFTYSKSKTLSKAWFNLLKAKCYWTGRITLKWFMLLAGIVLCTAHEKSVLFFQVTSKSSYQATQDRYLRSYQATQDRYLRTLQLTLCAI